MRRSFADRIVFLALVALLTDCRPPAIPERNAPGFDPMVCRNGDVADRDSSMVDCAGRLKALCEETATSDSGTMFSRLRKELESEAGCVLLYQFMCELALHESESIEAAAYLDMAIRVASDQSRLDIWRQSIDAQLEPALLITIDQAQADGDTESALEAIRWRNLLFEPDRRLTLRQIEMEAENGNDEMIVRLCNRLPASLRDLDIRIAAAAALEKLTRYDEAIEWIRPLAQSEKRMIVQERYTRLLELRHEANRPEQVRDLNQKVWVTREDLAAFVAWQFDLDVPDHSSVVMIDIQESPARAAIQACVELGLLSVGRDHRFRPLTRIQRNDLAIVCYEIIQVKRYSAVESVDGLPWDVPPGHFAARAIAMSVRLGLMTLMDDGSFQGGRQPGGAAVVDAISRLRTLVSSP
mgnify:CR=1 FL=1